VLALIVALTLVPPVPGPVERGFEYAGDPFAPGHHRGADLAARPGAPVRAACGGRVAFAGRAGANGRTVTIRCGPWSVTHLPLRELAVRAGERVVPGTTVGTAGASDGHEGIHLGVRRTADPRGYVDPAPLLRTPPRPAPPAAPRAVARRTASPPPQPAPSPWSPAPGTAPAASPASTAAGTGSSPLAPWPAWAGLALLLAGAAGAGAARRSRTRRASPARAKAAAVR
jgi:hypothetical protein